MYSKKLRVKNNVIVKAIISLNSRKKAAKNSIKIYNIFIIWFSFKLINYYQFFYIS